MLLIENVNIKLNSRNVKRLKELGYFIPCHWNNHHKQYCYNLGEFITIKVKDLSIGSHVKVKVCCDYCGDIIDRDYKEYIRSHDDEFGDCCKKCEYVKCEHTIREKYGVDKASEIPDYFIKIKNNNKKKYGVEWAAQLPETTEKRKQTNLKRYGVSHVLQNPNICAKAIKTRCENFKNPTSKPQRDLGELLEQLYGKCDLEVPCGQCSLDCVVKINSINIDVEYDGWFYHQDIQRDRRRDNFVKSCGYKILRIKGNKKDTLPSNDLIDKHIQQLLNSNVQYSEIVM